MPPTSEKRTGAMLENFNLSSLARSRLWDSDPPAADLRVLGRAKIIQNTAAHQPRTEMTMSQGRARSKSKPETPSIAHNGCQYKSLVNATSKAKEIATFITFLRGDGASARGPRNISVSTSAVADITGQFRKPADGPRATAKAIGRPIRITARIVRCPLPPPR